MSAEIRKFYADLNEETARFHKPFKTIFFCGGVILDSPKGRACCLRDYLIRKRSLRLPAKIIRAESATQLYRDTGYSDLINFEEDIARLASIVLVVAESPGSLAELGAFATNPYIKPSLRIIAQTKYETAESFIRYGPIEAVYKDNPDRVAFYPWELGPSGAFRASTARPHYSAMKKFLSEEINSIAKTSKFSHEDPSTKQFFVIYWILHLSYAISIKLLLEIVKEIYPDMSLTDLRDKLYCLRLMEWIDKQSYSGKEYYFALGDRDPVDYKLSVDNPDKDLFSRRARYLEELRKSEKIPKHIATLVTTRRGTSS